MPTPLSPSAGSSPENPITVQCMDAMGRPRTTEVFVRDGRVVVVQPSPGTAVYDWHGAAEMGSAVDQLRKQLPGGAR
ncbi:hypothetical protein EDD40_1569 [Saccharothrix texasensis]|uniref:Uncharacterized protein n=2 Tax=Saccharothrix texasensis TaxID=103734 RepID=A0A3N1H1D7_9PSEU|nr:hypothetical protein EDD40_1569 [Saccharothrix texasensis]